MHLIINHVAELQHVYNTNGCRLVEPFACATVMQICFSILRNACLVSIFCDLLYSRTVKDRGGKPYTEFLTCPCQNSLIDLTQVHPGRYTQRIENYINRSAIFKERHILGTHNFSYNTLVTMPSCHLIPDFHLTFFSDIDFCQTDDA